MRSRAWLVAAVTVVATVWIAPMQERISAQSASGIVISEYRFRGPNGMNDEFVELFNAGTAPVNVGGWLIRASNNPLLGTPSFATRVTITAGTVINPGCFYLVTNVNATERYLGSVPGNQTYTIGFADDGGVAVTTSNPGQIIDQVGNGTNPLAYGEGQRLAAFVGNINKGIERRPGGTSGHVDTDNNAADFQDIFPANPQNANPAMCLTPADIAIAASASASSVEQGQPLTVFGLVTPGKVPPSSGIQVTGDLSAVGGSAAAAFADSGVSPDAVANDGVYSAEVVVPLGNPPGAQPITLTATDAQGRSASHTIEISVTQPAVIYVPHEIQGAGAMSPMTLGDVVTVRGVVTARKTYGFFLQTEAGMEDADANTSEGLFVFASGAPLAAAQVGHIVHVRAAVAEAVPAADPASAPLTALNGVSFVVDAGTGTVPAAVELTSTELSADGALDQLERFEGMRVHVASLTAISGTGGVTAESDASSVSDGAFHAVLTGQPRPFRSAGVEPGYPVLPCAAAPCNVPLFDGNPERLRVDSDGLEGMAAIDVSTGAVMNDVTGPLDFESRTYTLLPEAALDAQGGLAIVSAPATAGDQFTIASFNMDRFFDNTDGPADDVVVTDAAFQTRVAKASMTIRGVLNTPDIVGVQDVESLLALTAVAQAVDADAGAAGAPAPFYTPYLVAGSDAEGLNVGFLVKTAGGRVSNVSVTPLGDAATFDRLPLMLHATITGPSTELPQTLTVIVSQLRPRAGSEADDADGALAREQRKAQAEFLANEIQVRQSNDPAEAIVSIGDYNAFSFNDGYADVVGTIAGMPASPDQVAVASGDLVSPDLVNLSELMPAAERYSAVVNGHAQTFDHVLATANFAAQFAGAVRPRVNADFAEALRGDPATPGRLSDRDPVVAYFMFPPDVVAPTLSNVPGDQTVEATGPDGATFSYVNPQASDNLDPLIAVVCAPASGSLFPLGNGGVVCSAQDAAGNSAEASFTVSVQDTTAPVLTVPAGITEVATSSAGRVISFTTTATDAVTASPAVNCTPASGSTFAVGDTVVTCAAADAAGNVATGTFTVTVTMETAPPPAPLPGRLAGAGAVVSGEDNVRFAFDVREGTTGGRGYLLAQVRRDRGRPGFFIASEITEVQFSNAAGTYATGGVDTVMFGGTGVFNGSPGYRFAVNAVDRGEPGRDRDTFAITVFAPNGEVVLSASGVLGDGNIQSHKQ